MNDLPKNVLVEVFLYLSMKELLQIFLVCKKWFSVGNHQRLWKLICKREFVNIHSRKWVNDYGSSRGWKSLYYLLRGIKLPSMRYRYYSYSSPVEDELVSSHSTHLVMEANLVVFASASGIIVCDLLTGKTINDFARIARRFGREDVAISNFLLATTDWISDTNRIIIWDVYSGYIISKLSGHEKMVISIAFEDDIIASLSIDNNIKIWNINNKKCIYNYFDTIKCKCLALNKKILPLVRKMDPLISFTLIILILNIILSLIHQK